MNTKVTSAWHRFGGNTLRSLVQVSTGLCALNTDYSIAWDYEPFDGTAFETKKLVPGQMLFTQTDFL